MAPLALLTPCRPILLALLSGGTPCSVLLLTSSSFAPGRISDDAQSDVDSDLEELQGDMAKFDQSVREFLASHRGSQDVTPPPRASFRGRGARGPRKAAKPRGDITARLSRVNQAFLAGDYDGALNLAFEVIRINAETHQAWTALSSIFRERGELKRALSAMVYAAHLRPKDVNGWLRCASFALDTIGAENNEGGAGIDTEAESHGPEDSNLHTARLCYSAALRADPSNMEARLGKADVCRRQGQFSAAISEYKALLQRRPYDLDLVRKLAEACMDSKNSAAAVDAPIHAYRRFFGHDESWQLGNALWHDVGIYAELLATAGRYQEAIDDLKSLSRRLAGRAGEQYWDRWREDDREWDADDRRRALVPEYDAVGADFALYGAALPHDLRVRLATYRLKLGHEEEALVRQPVEIRIPKSDGGGYFSR